MNATLVTSLDDILENISTFESYLSKTTSFIQAGFWAIKKTLWINMCTIIL